MPRIQLLLAIILTLICASCKNQFATSPAPTTAEGHAAILAEEYERAIEIYTKVLSNTPADGLALRGRGTAYHLKGDYDRALEDLNAAIEINGDDGIAFNNRAYLSRDLGRNESAIADFEEAIERGHDSPDLRHNLALLYSTADRFEEAIDECSAAIDLDPSEPVYYINRGGYHMKLEQCRAAEEDFTAAIQLAPDNYVPWALRHNAHRCLGEIENARHDGETAHRLNPDWSIPGSNSYASFPAVGLKLLKFDEFEIAENFYGFQNLELQSSVMAVSIPGPYLESTQEFSAESMESRGLMLRSKEDVEIEGLTGMLLDATHEEYGTHFAKWILAFGNDHETKVVTATFPMSLEAELSIPLRLVVISAKLDKTQPPSPESEVDFSVVTSPKLKLTRGIGKMLMYTKDGVVPSKSSDDPVFIVVPSLTSRTIAGDLQVTFQPVCQTANTKIGSIISIEDVVIDGLNGFEIVADGENAEHGTPLTLYTVTLRDDGEAILIHGRVTKQEETLYLPEFKAMAHSLTRKPR